MIIITEPAQAYFAELLAQRGADIHLRLFVSAPGTPQAECGMAFCPVDAIEADDTQIEFSGFKAIIDTNSAPFMQDAYIDLVDGEEGPELTLHAPNAIMRELPEDAPLHERVDFIIQTKINPQLAGHNGYITLSELTEDGVALIEFGGGCNGCSMVSVTLKEGVENQLLEHFPNELKAVRDLTDHQSGDHSYYQASTPL